MKNSRFSVVLKIISLCVFFVLLSGCAHTSKPWGAKTTIWPGWQTYGEAAKDAIADPHTWIPLIGAGIFLTGDADEKFTRWAVRKNLMFDSEEAASDYSDDWHDATEWLVYASALAAPSGDEPSEWLLNKGKGLFATAIILDSSYTISKAAKKPFDRKRPDGSNNNSFPSAHALRSSMRATMTARNIETLPIVDPAKFAMKAGVYGLAGMTAWARLEANSHYPSDVLVGYSLGHFFGAFLNDAFITPVMQNQVRLNTSVLQDGWRFGITKNFD